MKQGNSSKPKYERIKEDILAQIRKNDFSYSEPLCTEKQLSEQYQVSRITAKHALTDLEQMGVLYRKRGVGSFVAPNAANNLNRLTPPKHITSKMVSFLLPFDITKGGMFKTVEVVNNTLNANGCIMSIYVSGAKEKSNLRLLLSQNLSGLIYYPERDKIHLELLNEFVFMNIPIIVIDKTTDCPYIHNIVSDNFEGGRLLGEHLIQLGHRNITFFTTAPLEETSTVRNRFAGFLHALYEGGIQPNSSNFVYYPHKLTEEDCFASNSNSLQDTLRSLYQAGTTAIIAENDRVAQLLSMTCKAMDIRIPEDISLCGFDNDDAIRNLNITTIGQDFTRMGQEIGHIFTESVNNPDYPIQKITIPVELFPRSSTNAPRILL